MAFKKGEPRPKNAGRKAGSINKRSFDARALAEAKGCDPLEILIDIAKGDWASLGYESESIKKVNLGIEYKEAVITLDNRMNAANEAAKYIYPQLKSMELTGKDGKDLFAERLMNAQNRIKNMHTLAGDAQEPEVIEVDFEVVESVE